MLTCEIGDCAHESVHELGRFESFRSEDYVARRDQSVLACGERLARSIVDCECDVERSIAVDYNRWRQENRRVAGLFVASVPVDQCNGQVAIDDLGPELIMPWCVRLLDDLPYRIRKILQGRDPLSEINLLALV